ncbi:hypothetical protein DNTS_025987 [Danionella cerebrum]|uniref:Fibronectin type-III domain-containing protein n=1 Tax=Danionella cerebrum TaxID=2873325 RepID=A0A553PVF0_9TELE|nr:hypothetical protein DNTS_025987 [Danionella translucida]
MFLLTGLTDGVYNVCVMAHTRAGGTAGPCQMLAVEAKEVLPIMLSALFLTSLLLMISVSIRMKMKPYLCPTVPDPSKSSLSSWSISKPCEPFPSTIIPLSPAASISQDHEEKEAIPVTFFSYSSVRPEEPYIELKNHTESTKPDPAGDPEELLVKHRNNPDECRYSLSYVPVITVQSYRTLQPEDFQSFLQD